MFLARDGVRSYTYGGMGAFLLTLRRVATLRAVRVALCTQRLARGCKIQSLRRDATPGGHAVAALAGALPVPRHSLSSENRQG